MVGLMATHKFTSTDGKRYPCVHPEGSDPLLVPPRPGQLEIHPRWHDDKFWRKVNRRVEWEEKFKEVQQATAQEARKT
jgi:hypothetical protein